MRDPTLPSRRKVLAAAPVIAIAGFSTALATEADAIAAPKVGGASRMAEAIAAHRAAWRAYTASLDRLDEAEATWEPAPADTRLPGVYGKSYGCILGKVEILQDIGRDHAAMVDAIRGSLAANDVSEATIGDVIAKVDARAEVAIAGANAFFDDEDARRAASPYGAADRESQAAGRAEQTAWASLIALPCETLADVQARAAYLLGCERMERHDFEQEELAALLRSMLPDAVRA